MNSGQTTSRLLWFGNVGASPSLQFCGDWDVDCQQMTHIAEGYICNTGNPTDIAENVTFGWTKKDNSSLK